jgi:heavy metal sensor kinase
MAAVLATSGAFLYLRLQADLWEAVDAGLRSRAAELLGNLDVSVGALRGGSALADPDEAFAQVLDEEGRIVESSSGLEAQPLLSAADLVDVAGVHFFEAIVPTVEEPVPARLLAVPAGDGRVLVVGASLEDQHDAVARLGVLLVLGGPLALALASGVGWLVAGAALRPVERMRAEAAAISASEPGRRLPPSGTDDELARLGETLNGMLERLEQALDRERRFVDEASHELRTPLANLRTELDLALRRSRRPEELEAALRSAAEDTERLARLAEDLLVLARTDHGRVPLRREPVALGPLVEGALQAFATQAAKGGVSIESRVPEGIKASLDPLRLRQVIGNLLDNALRYTPRGGMVTFEAAHADGTLTLEVRDTGEGFPASFLPSAFEPFARPDTARSRPGGGTGLGLAIVRAVAEAHGGVAEARNLPQGGASVTLRIPA